MDTTTDRTMYDVYNDTQHSRDYGYHALTIRVFVMTDWGSLQTVVNLRWQSNADKPTDWYAMHIEIDADSPDKLARAAALAKRLFNGQDEYNPTPSWLIARLAKLKIARAVYDKRMGQHVPTCELADDDTYAYNDDRDSYGAQFFYTHVMAKGQREAQKLIAAAMAQDTDRLAKWSAAGCKVLRSNNERPFVPELAAIITPNGQH